VTRCAKQPQVRPRGLKATAVDGEPAPSHGTAAERFKAPQISEAQGPLRALAMPLPPRRPSASRRWQRSAPIKKLKKHRESWPNDAQQYPAFGSQPAPRSSRTPYAFNRVAATNVRSSAAAHCNDTSIESCTSVAEVKLMAPAGYSVARALLTNASTVP